MNKVLVAFLLLVFASHAEADVLLSTTPLTGTHGDQIELHVYSTGSALTLGGPMDTFRVDIVTLNPDSVEDLVNAFDAVSYTHLRAHET